LPMSSPVVGSVCRSVTPPKGELVAHGQSIRKNFRRSPVRAVSPAFPHVGSS
jgi:hypothetical protein